MTTTDALEKRLSWLVWGNTSLRARTYAPETKAIYNQIFTQGDTYYMHERFCDLVDYARRTLPDDLKFEPEWILSKSGFMVLEKGFSVPEVQEWEDSEVEAMMTKTPPTISAIGWMVLSQPQLDRVNQQIKDGDPNLRRFLGKTLLPGAVQFCCFVDLATLAYKTPRTGFGVWSYFVLNPGDAVLERVHTFEDRAREQDGAGFYREERSMEILHEARWVYTAFHMMAQKLTIQKQDRAQRATRRRMQRENLHLSETIRTITLRRMEEERPKEAGGAVDWKWQWMVHGFWRKQYYPSTQEHKQIWIEDYVKGPQDKPMKPATPTVYVAGR